MNMFNPFSCGLVDHSFVAADSPYLPFSICILPNPKFFLPIGPLGLHLTEFFFSFLSTPSDFSPSTLSFSDFFQPAGPTSRSAMIGKQLCYDTFASNPASK